ncbi:MAG: hypothetical protein A2017_16555 [Lentisphaerae bacterium GWF2_44_16]|nr:MAG: hypothetical protein A2017_16555 [Lentisphaerae bacterium GWF2_44_16]
MRWYNWHISLSWLKFLISLTAIGIIVVRLVYPDLKIDAIALGFVVLALLPWFSEIIETLKFPGGWEITFRDIQKAGEKVADTSVDSSSSESSSESEKPAYLAVANKDPNLALAGLRIEIEKRLRTIARKHSLPDQLSLIETLHRLRQNEVLTSSSLSGLQELISAGNQAVHGARVEPDVADWAISNGPILLSNLDNIAKDSE